MVRKSQLYTLNQAMIKAGDSGMSKEQIAKVLHVKLQSAPLYIFELKSYYSAEFETVKKGRTVVRYILKNGEDLNIPMYGKKRGRIASVKQKNNKPAAAVTKSKKVVDAKPIKAAAVPPKKLETFDDLVITEWTDSEVTDLKSNLGFSDVQSYA